MRRHPSVDRAMRACRPQRADGGQVSVPDDGMDESDRYTRFGKPIAAAVDFLRDVVQSPFDLARDARNAGGYSNLGVERVGREGLNMGLGTLMPGVVTAAGQMPKYSGLLFMGGPGPEGAKYVGPGLDHTRNKGFYSRSMRLLHDSGQPKGSVQQYLAWMKGKGIKDEELKTLYGHLDPNAKVTKDEMLAAGRDKFPRMGEVELTEDGYDKLEDYDLQARMQEDAAEALRGGDEIGGYRVEKLDPDHPDYEDGKPWVVIDPDGDVHSRHANKRTAISDAADEYAGNVDLDEQRKYLDAGEAYGTKTRYEDYREGAEGGSDYRENLLMHTGPYAKDVSTHWDHPSVAVHYRTDEWRKADQPNTGDTVRLMQELQSDWGQKLRTQGVRASDEEIARLEAEHNAASAAYKAATDQAPRELSGQSYGGDASRLEFLDKLQANVRAAQGNPNEIVSARQLQWFANAYPGIDAELAPLLPRGTTSAVRQGDLYPILQNYFDRSYDEAVQSGAIQGLMPEEAQRLIEEMQRTRLAATESRQRVHVARDGVPSAPLVGDTDTWAKLGIRSFLWDLANDRSVNYGAWTPGSVQEGRFGDHLAGFYDKQIPKYFDDVIRKDLGLNRKPERIGLGSEDGTVDVNRVSDGISRELEQEGQRRLPFDYTQDLAPRAVGDRGGSLEIPRTVATNESSAPYLTQDHAGNPRWAIADDDTLRYSQFRRTSPGALFMTQDSAQRALDIARQRADEATLQVPGYQIDDEMRDTIKRKGFPLWMHPTAVATGGLGVGAYMRENAPLSAYDAERDASDGMRTY